MTNKIIAAGIAAALAGASMISFANAEAVSVNTFSAEMENTTVSVGSATETTTANGGEVEENVRNIKPLDDIVIDYSVELYRPDGRVEETGSYEVLSIIGIDDENQRYRVYVPRFCTEKKGFVLYLSYSDTVDAEIVTHNGYVIGDLYDDAKVDVFDIAVMKKGILSNWAYDKKKPAQLIKHERSLTLADINGDDEVSVIDLIMLQRWVLGLPYTEDK